MNSLKITSFSLNSFSWRIYVNSSCFLCNYRVYAVHYLLNSIVVNNTSTSGVGDIYLDNSASATAYYTWFAETSGTIAGDDSAPNQTGLAPLADNGGPTRTMAVQNSSCPAVSGGAWVYYNETDGYYFYDTGNSARKLSDWGPPSNSQPSDKITTDQRGVDRHLACPTIGVYAFPA